MASRNVAIPGPGGKKRVVAAPKPGSAAYWAKYGAGTGQGVNAVRPLIPGQHPGEKAVVAGTRAAPYLVETKPPAPKPAPTAGAGATTTTTTTGTTAAPSTPRSPWQDYLDMIDKREQDFYDKQRQDVADRAKRYQDALYGFGQALSGSAASDWAKVIQGYGQAGQSATAYGAALASDYGQGLQDANRQIASDFASIGQGGAPVIRDDAAALEQIRTQGGARPDQMAGLVGRAWGSYGETRPGSINFMTEQDIAQAQRTSLDDQAKVDEAQAQAREDNPAAAIQMWQAEQEYKSAGTKAQADAAQQKFDNALKTAQNKREQQAFNLTYLKAGQDQADKLTNQTGKLWLVNPNTGRPYNTGKAAPGSKAYTSAAATAVRKAAALETAAHNRATEGIANSRINISQQTADAATKRAGAYARYQDWKRTHPNATGKGPGGLKASDIRQWGKRAGDIAYLYRNGNAKTGFPTGSAADAMAKMIGEKIPYQIAWNAIYQEAIKKDSPWADALAWNPGYKPPKEKSKKPDKRPR